jgi:hypothetical protein
MAGHDGAAKFWPLCREAATVAGSRWYHHPISGVVTCRAHDLADCACLDDIPSFSLREPVPDLSSRCPECGRLLELCDDDHDQEAA